MIQGEREEDKKTLPWGEPESNKRKEGKIGLGRSAYRLVKKSALDELKSRTADRKRQKKEDKRQPTEQKGT